MSKDKPHYDKVGDRATSPDARPASAPVPSSSGSGAVEPRASDRDVTAFVERMRSIAPSAVDGRGRLVFAMDATMSRQPTWDMALHLQGEMFAAVKSVGGLDVQLVYFRGLDECRASKWVSDPAALARLMSTVGCRGGNTQIGKVLSHARAETTGRRVNALVYVGDAMEENVDALCAKAGELAILGVPVFLFQEGSDPAVSRAFKEIARVTKGAWCRFDAGAAAELKALLTAVAVYAAGGHKALVALSQRPDGRAARLLLTEMKPGSR